VHLNYYFIRSISSVLDKRLQGSRLISAFSQNKDELIIQFSPSETGRPDFYIKCLMSSSLTCLSFPEDFHRARKNSVDLFSDLNDLNVLQLSHYENERAFSINFEKGYSLVFKLFGNRSNILLFLKTSFKDMFHKKMEGDAALKLPLDRTLTPTFEQFKEKPELVKWFPSFRGLPELYLESNGYNLISSLEKWEMIGNTINNLLHPVKYYLLKQNDQFRLSMLPVGEIFEETNDPLIACNKFF